VPSLSEEKWDGERRKEGGTGEKRERGWGRKRKTSPRFGTVVCQNSEFAETGKN